MRGQSSIHTPILVWRKVPEPGAGMAYTQAKQIYKALQLEISFESERVHAQRGLL